VTSLFITSSGTGVGKTLVTASLARQLRRAGRTARVLKPVISGFTREEFGESDTAILLQSQETAPTEDAIDRMSPFRFAAPLSPDMAAAREDRSVDFDALVTFCREAAAGPEDITLIEGVGGVMVPLTERETVLDWMAALGAPCLLVVGSYLGTISHTLTAAAALADRRLAVSAIVISESEESPVPVTETQATIQRFLPDTRIAVVPRLSGDKPWQTAPNLTDLV
jgi:dethiobiotin synthetase